MSTTKETLEQRAQKFIEQFSPTTERLQTCLDSFKSELLRGMQLHAKDPDYWHPSEATLMMLDTCVDYVPTGLEKGVFYAVDFGGTNLRAVRVNLNGQGLAEIKQLKHNMRDVKVSASLADGLLDKKASATMLFDEIAIAVKSLMEKEGDANRSKAVGVGFTFSFPMNQKTIDSAILQTWTKGFQTGIDTTDPVIGRDVCALLNVAFDRNNVKAHVCCVLNDTVGAMLAGAYSKSLDMPQCTVGVILGTGMNGAYLQPNAKKYGYQGVIMNTELGGFDVNLPLTAIDFEIDFESTNRGRQKFEKMCSGMYIGEICRIAIRNGFKHTAPPAAWVPHSMNSELGSEIYNDKRPFDATKAALIKSWSWTISTAEAEIVHRYVSAVFNRSAAVSAVAICAMAHSTGRLQPAMGGVTVGIDGSLYLCNPPYQQMLHKYLEVIVGKATAALINCVVAEDGSGKGAAILAGTIINNS